MNKDNKKSKFAERRIEKNKRLLLEKYNLTQEDLKDKSKVDQNEVMNKFINSYSRSLPSDRLEFSNKNNKSKDNKLDVESHRNSILTANFKYDFAKIEKDKLKFEQYEKEHKELVKSMMFRSNNHFKANKKVIDFWKELDKNY